MELTALESPEVQDSDRLMARWVVELVQHLVELR
jgi:hypothetical protein